LLQRARPSALSSPGEAQFDGDVVVAVPESGVTASLGYSAESGIPYRQGLTKNRYIGRTFIRDSQMEREIGVRLKLNAIERSCAGKRVVLVDDSIVRGTTGARLIDLMRKAGAVRVDLAVSSPPIKFPCRYGIDTASRQDLVAAVKTEDEIREMIGADALHYLSIGWDVGSHRRIGRGARLRRAPKILHRMPGWQVS